MKEIILRDSLSKKDPHLSRDGFTLLEVLISLAFLSIGLLAIVSMQITAMEGNSYSNNLTIATTLAEDKLENLKRLSFNDPNLADSDSNPKDIDTDIKSNPSLFSHADHPNDLPQNSEFIRVWNVADNTPVANIKRVTVIVGWQDDLNGNNTSHYVALSTLLR